ncbi:MAG: DUF4352 domain-containing protein [Dermatophilus congolensis]|nr:DUF4352 domain-containing protein [Dermatophilus congolensis]
MSSQIDSPTNAKAQAKADKAYQKAMRPWFKKKRFVIPLILIALMVIISALSGGDDSSPASTTTGTNSQQQTKADPAAATIGQPVSDGKFEFTVTEVETPGKSIGTTFPEEAQGTWVIVRVDVTNTGKEAGTLSADSQKAFDDQGREFSARQVPSLDDWDKAFLTAVNPGNTVKNAPIVFDVPEGATLQRIELHDSLFSGGAEVSLKK